jgi:mRNA-degrading endonuclease RelE of RelBE toxin-antitoxin system
MTYQVKTLPEFDKELKKLVKKYPSLKEDVLKLAESLAAEPTQGTPIFKNCYKIRLAIKSKGKGKSGGARVITNFVIHEDSVFLLTIYDKSEKENVTDAYIKALLDSI